MITVLSPAKTLKRLTIPFINDINNEFKPPELFGKSLELVQKIKTLSTKDLTKLMEVSDSIAKLNFERYQNFPEQLKFDESYPCFFLFYGDVYKELQLNDYKKEHLKFLQKHIRILSGLYGILKPFDLIYPYRLEMGTDLSKFKIFENKSLYEYWNGIITSIINKELKHHKTPVLLNLASNEYFDSIQLNELSYPVINIFFQERRNGSYKTIAINSKRARGKMANWIILNQIDDIESLKNFNVDNYKFSKEKSDDSNWYFLKN